jgi:outer membrane protein
MSLRKGFLPLFACSAFLALAQTAGAQVKAAVVNLQQAVFESAEIRQADADMTAKYKPRQQEIDTLTAQGQAAASKLEAGQGKLTPQAETELNSQIARLQREVQRRSEDLSADVDRDRNEVLGKATERMSAVIKKMAEEKGLDLVVDTATSLYYKPAMDLTKEAVAAYDKAYPVTSGAAAPAKPASK